MSRALLARAEEAWADLERWMRERDFAGFDPYDLAALPWRWRLDVRPALPLAARAARAALRRLERRRPLSARRLLRVRPAVNPMTHCLAARAYLARAAVTGDRAWIELADRSLAWLRARSSAAPGQLGWGYSFRWFAGHHGLELPAGTPLGIVTVEGGHALLDRYELGADPADLADAARCGRFVLEGLNRDELDAERVCFSYSPLDRFHVLNASMACAAFLLRLERAGGVGPEARDLARRARRYCVELQNGDGSWFYWGPPDYDAPNYARIDGYHTGMVLQWLELCRVSDVEPPQDDAIEKGLAFYLRWLIEEDGAPRDSPASPFPRDIHAFAQALVTLSALRAHRDAAARLRRVLAWGLDRLRNSDGSFAYQLHAERADRTPYMRWGQAWSLWGLACACAALTRPVAP